MAAYKLVIKTVEKNWVTEMAMKYKKSAFTLVELLAVLGIITILVGLLIPALTMVRNTAREAQQKAQLTTIEIAITAFKNDYGDYPPSDRPIPPGDYGGAQKLAEALVGWDLMGFHPDSAWRSNGRDTSGKLVYDSTDIDNLKKRRGPYLELATANVFRLDDLFDGDAGDLEEDTFVICDVFGIKPITLANGKVVKAGTPILYYKANTSSKIHNTGSPKGRIYNCIDNLVLTTDIKMTNPDVKHKISDDGSFTSPSFYEYITDPKVAVPWPYRPDSYLLITAGADGLYGTSDDICNF